MNRFGWDYPAGAENDPHAPYNQGDGLEECSAALMECYGIESAEDVVCDEDDMGADYTVCPLRRDGYCNGSPSVGGSKGVHPKWKAWIARETEAQRKMDDEMYASYMMMYASYMESEMAFKAGLGEE